MRQDIMNFDAIRSKKMGVPPNQYGRVHSIRERQTAHAHPFIKFLRKHLLLIILGVLFIVGLFLGTIFVGSAEGDTKQALEIILSGYLGQRQTQSFVAVLSSTFFSAFALLLALFFCGFCTISQIFILALPFFKGLGYGFSVGSLYMEYGMRAFSYVSVMQLPVMLLSTLLLLCAAKTAFVLSLRLFRSSMAQSEDNEQMAVKRYCVKFAAYVVLAFGIALLDAVLVWQFGSLIVL